MSCLGPRLPNYDGLHLCEQIGLGQCMKNKWVAKGEGGTLVRGGKGEGVVEDTVRQVLQKVEGGEALGDQQAKDLKRRKLVTQVYSCICLLPIRQV